MVVARSPRKILVKVAAAVAGAAAVGFLIMQTARSSRAEPYTLPAEALQPWTLSVEVASAPNDAVLVLRPPLALSAALFEQTFKRSMESMRAPDTSGIPLALQGELDRAGAARVSPDELLALARRAGLDGASPAARCLGHRHLPEPETRQQIFFAIFDSPAFAAFRQALAARLGPPFDPGFISPVMSVGTVESSTQRWLPLRADADKDCVAPIVTAGR